MMIQALSVVLSDASWQKFWQMTLRHELQNRCTFSEPCQTPKMERVPILDVWQGFECFSA